MRAKCFFRPCASIAPSLVSRVESGSEKTTIENRQKGNEVTELAEITNDGMNRKGMGNDERLGGEIGRRAKGNRRRITKESDWRQKRGETKGRMLAFRKNTARPKESCRGCLTLAAT